MKTIGLTGGIASGKSTVSETLEKMGAIILDADKIAHSVMESGEPAWQEIVDFFGRDILNEDKSINRKELGKIVFNDPEKLAKLNAITHYRIREKLRAELKAIETDAADKIVVVEIPLLYETGWEKWVDEVWVVWVDRETQIRRLIKRDGIDRKAALQRIESQMSLDEKARRANIVIDNSYGLEETIESTARNFNVSLQHS